MAALPQAVEMLYLVAASLAGIRRTASFCASGARMRKARSVPMFDSRHFRHILTDFRRQAP